MFVNTGLRVGKARLLYSGTGLKKLVEKSPIIPSPVRVPEREHDVVKILCYGKHVIAVLLEVRLACSKDYRTGTNLHSTSHQFIIIEESA